MIFNLGDFFFDGFFYSFFFWKQHYKQWMCTFNNLSLTCYYVLTDNLRFIHWETDYNYKSFLNWVLFTRWHSMSIQNFCVTDQQLHALIRLAISPPSFDTGARMKYLCGPQLNQTDKDFNWAEIWTRISQLRSRRSNHYSTSFRCLCDSIKALVLNGVTMGCQKRSKIYERPLK
jgi:hypothetical protein